MSEDVTAKIQAKADSLTADRKRRGKTIPEGLASADDISQYRQLASHTVCLRVLLLASKRVILLL